MTMTRALTLAALLAGLLACSKEQPVEVADVAETATDHAANATAIIAEVEEWVIEFDPLLRMQLGLPIKQLPDLSLASMENSAAFAQDILDRIEAIDVAEIAYRDELTLLMIDNAFQNLVNAPEQYWYTFAVTPYQGLFSMYSANAVMPGMPLATEEERANYLAVVDDLAAMIEEQGAKTIAQQRRGILIPKAAIPGVRQTATGGKAALAAAVTPAPGRLEGVDATEAEAFMGEVIDRIENRINPAFDAILAIVDGDYEASAPDAVGMSQYDGGEEAYRRAVKQSTTYDVSPEELHEMGLEILRDLQAKMQAIRDEVGFEGTQQEFHDMLRKHPRFIASDPSEVEERYMSYMERMDPVIGDYFSRLPSAPYGVKRLDPAAEPGQTFGFYQMPNAVEPRGLYRYNGSSLDERPMVWAQGLIYHELNPGHHLQLVLQSEMEDLPTVSKSLFLFGVTAYSEGWAEYASGLGIEMGLYDDPYDLYGRYLMESFLATRLVVDTGTNLYGWPLEKARQFMRENTFASETEVATESLRYSTDIPAQALGYGFGSYFIWDLRRAKEAELGDRFDIKAFHDAVLGAGVLPMWVLEKHVDRQLQ